MIHDYLLHWRYLYFCTRMLQIQPDVFPLLDYQKQPASAETTTFNSVNLAEPFLTFWLRSRKGRRFERCAAETAPEEIELSGWTDFIVL